MSGKDALDRANGLANLLSPMLALISAIVLGGMAWGASTIQISHLADGQDELTATQKEVAADVRRLSEMMATLHALADANRDRIARLEAQQDRRR